MRAWSEAERALASALRAEAEVVVAKRSSKLAIALLVAVLPLLAAFSAVGTLRLGDAPPVVLAALGSVACPFTIAGSAAFGYFRAAARRTRQIAALPFVALRGSGLEPRCPACGAPVVAHELLGRCVHCHAVGLLPSPMVEVALRARHAEVMAARLRGEALAERIEDTQVAVNQSVAVGFIVLGGLAALGFPLGFALFPPRAYTGGPVIEDAWQKGLVSGLVMGILLGGFGVIGLVSAKRKVPLFGPPS